MNFSSFPPLMQSPQIMSAHLLQPSPFTPDQFLTRPGPSMPVSPLGPHSQPNTESLDEEMSSPHGFIKKRPIEVTEDLIEGRFESLSPRLRRCRSLRAIPSRCSEPPDLGFAPAMGVEPRTPPNRPQCPVPHDMTFSDDTDHFLQSRRKCKSRRSAKIGRFCAVASRRKTSSRESSPSLARTRSPLGRWTPHAVSAFQPFSAGPPELSATPPRPTSYPFTPQAHAWTNGFPWTITSPSTSPYPAHSPPQQHQS